MSDLLVILVTHHSYTTSNAMGQVIWPLFQRFIDSGEPNVAPPMRYFPEDDGSEDAYSKAQANFVADLESQVTFWKAVENDEFFPLDNTNPEVAEGLTKFAAIFGDLCSRPAALLSPIRG